MSEIEEIKIIFWKMFRRVIKKYPKRSKQVKKLIALEKAIYSFYYSLEEDER